MKEESTFIFRGINDKSSSILMENTRYINFVTPPKPVGAYIIAEVFYTCKVKPKWIHRKMMNLVLGIKWVDLDDTSINSVQEI